LIGSVLHFTYLCSYITSALIIGSKISYLNKNMARQSLPVITES